MNDENRRTNCASELARAEEAMRAARVLIDANLLSDAESRLYYAAYHAVAALLLSQGLEARSHAGVGELLGRHFVKTGRLDPGDARLFARLQKCRIEADYSTGFVVTLDAAQEDVAACTVLIERIRGLVATLLP